MLLLVIFLSLASLVYSYKNIHFQSKFKYSTSINTVENNINLVQNDGPVLSFTIPNKRVRIHIVGCIHGSPTSSSYVKKVLETVKNPSAIVLELCDKRYKSLLEDKLLIENNKESNHEKEITSISSVGLLVYCLSILTYAQRGVKIIPGAEFITAMNLAETRNIPIEMGDEEVEKIITALKGIGNVQLFLKKPSSILTTIQSMAFSITGNFGYVSSSNKIGNYDMTNASWLNILPAFFRESNLVRDTFILMSPSFIPLALVSTIANYVMDNYQSFPFNTFSTDIIDNSTMNYLSQLGDILTNIFTLYWGLVVTNIFRYVIVDRDQIIASKISKVCDKISEEKKKDNNNEISDIVCVLGMLHSNGVIRYLLNEESNESRKP
jgi:pheromone shutdown protein TraB